MPVRTKAVTALARALDGPLHFNTLEDVAVFSRTGPMPLPDFYARYDRAYVQVIDDIDWNRVLLEATSRHLDLNHRDEGYDGFTTVDNDGNLVTGVVCPECLTEALLRLRLHDWHEHPKAPRTHPGATPDVPDAA